MYTLSSTGRTSRWANCRASTTVPVSTHRLADSSSWWTVNLPFASIVAHHEPAWNQSLLCGFSTVGRAAVPNDGPSNWTAVAGCAADRMARPADADGTAVPAATDGASFPGTADGAAKAMATTTRRPRPRAMTGRTPAERWRETPKDTRSPWTIAAHARRRTGDRDRYRFVTATRPPPV